ncbi:YcjF family protein [uncultured Roseobacter sp.]|uniref:YcjF family protein n=1 Tax=uncultured Roseobacter sp. TaxID=114847 RepID=UPI0026177E4B|nr:TIGR01620 family protein [uncultured Roseobacter sp.]
MARGPVLIDLEDEQTEASVADAPPVPDVAGALPQGQAMQVATRIAARPPSRLGRWFLGLAAALVGAFASLAAWDVVNGLIERNAVLGWGLAGLAGAFLSVLLLVVLRELAAIGRLGRIDGLRRAADTAHASQDLKAAGKVTQQLVALYKGREETRWGRERFADLAGDQLDADALLRVAETEILMPLDAVASREVEAAARQVATVTALVPLALADVVAALAANLRMIRRIAEIYGGRAGVLGSWRLARAVTAHLVATGAVAVGDDMLESVLGGSLLGRLSRRFGEGVVNGALTARVGVAAMEVCRPLPFGTGKRPKVRDIIRNSLSGLFGSGKT